MNVTFVISSLAAGGAQRVMSFLANQWVKAGWRVRILVFSGPGVEPFFPLDSHVEYVRLGIEGGIVESDRRNLQQHSPDYSSAACDSRECCSCGD